MTPMASMKSATGSTLSVLVLTALKSDPAVWPGCASYLGCGGIALPVCAAAGLANAAPTSNAIVPAETAIHRVDQSFIQRALENSDSVRIIPPQNLGLYASRYASNSIAKTT